VKRFAVVIGLLLSVVGAYLTATFLAPSVVPRLVWLPRPPTHTTPRYGGTCWTTHSWRNGTLFWREQPEGGCA
jgi:hypothetical protein